LLLLVIKVASLMRFESGDKVAVGGALTIREFVVLIHIVLLSALDRIPPSSAT
jgi:hypothetical protein